MTMFTIWKMLRLQRSSEVQPGDQRTAASKRAASRTDHTTALAVIAFAVATAVFLTVLGGLHAFIYRATPAHTFAAVWGWSGETTGMNDASVGPTYVSLALFASLLLLVPLSTLAGSAARLVASRRDAELASLRLMGATGGQVTALTALDATAQALGGTVLGIVGYFALLPAVMLLHFQASTFTFTQLWVGPLALVGVVVGVTLLALVSALISLRGVVISPLGVSARRTPAALSKWRLWIFLAVFALGMAGSKLINFAGDDSFAVIMVIMVPIIATFLVINLLGPLVIRHSARRRLARARTASQLIAMRRILDNPKRAWRNVSGVALAVFIAGMTSLASFMGSLDTSGYDPQQVTLMHDIGMGGLLTLFFAAVLAAVSSGVMQAGSIYDQASEYRMLILEGADARVLAAARRKEVMTPLWAVTAVSAACSLFLMIPIMGQALTQPATMLSFVGGIALCFVLVYVGSLASNRAAASLDLLSVRADD
ncbi:MAG: ABC transporter permease [Bifidobacteriaceae bacterium]|jgi:hypothetical protein|nr:ABC transporter permease [Bifidobacteriaceae bacterium]